MQTDLTLTLKTSTRPEKLKNVSPVFDGLETPETPDASETPTCNVAVQVVEVWGLLEPQLSVLEALITSPVVPPAAIKRLFERLLRHAPAMPEEVVAATPAAHYLAAPPDPALDVCLALGRVVPAVLGGSLGQGAEAAAVSAAVAAGAGVDGVGGGAEGARDVVMVEAGAGVDGGVGSGASAQGAAGTGEGVAAAPGALAAADAAPGPASEAPQVTMEEGAPAGAAQPVPAAGGAEARGPGRPLAPSTQPVAGGVAVAAGAAGASRGVAAVAGAAAGAAVAVPEDSRVTSLHRHLHYLCAVLNAPEDQVVTSLLEPQGEQEVRAVSHATAVGCGKGVAGCSWWAGCGCGCVGVGGCICVLQWVKLACWKWME